MRLRTKGLSPEVAVQRRDDDDLARVGAPLRELDDVGEELPLVDGDDVEPAMPVEGCQWMVVSGGLRVRRKG